MPVTWLEAGKRVLVSESNQAEKFHECCQLPWNANLHSVWQGKVGVITRVGKAGDTATVRFYEWNQPQSPGSNYNKRLFEVEALYHCRVLKPVEKLHFLNGDRPVLVEIGNGNTQKPAHPSKEANHVSLRIAGEENGEPQYSLKTSRAPSFLWKQSEHPNEVLLPVYIGKNKQFVMRDRSVSGPESGVDSNAARVIWGELKGTPGSELITAIRTWEEHGGSHLRIAAQRFPDQVNTAVGGKTPLAVAVEESIWPAIVSLIALSANRESVDSNGNTLLHAAAAKGNVRILEGLIPFLERDVNKPNQNGDTALHIAAREQNAACVDRLLCVHMVHTNTTNNAGDTIMHVVCNSPETSSPAVTTILGRILSNPRVNLNLSNEQGLTALHMAIIKGNAKCVELITMSRPNLLVSPSVQPLQFAAMHGKNKVVDTLLTVSNELGVELTLPHDGKTPLHAAVETWQGDVDSDLGRLACIQALSAAGIPAGAVDGNGQTACHLLVKYLNANLKNMDPNILRNAIAYQRATVKLDELAAKLRPHWQLAALCFLAARGCDLAAKDKEGKSAIDICEDEKLRDTLHLLSSDRLRCCLPMGGPKEDFNTSDVHMCTFNCENSVANVQFVPCGHRMICHKCAVLTPLRRCPLCYTNITSAIDTKGNPVELGSALKSPSAAPSTPPTTPTEKKSVVVSVTMPKGKETTTEAGDSSENEKLKEIQELKEKLLKLEMETSCAICLDARPSLVFNCGHTSCSECAETLKLCHICRQPIEQKQVIYT